MSFRSNVESMSKMMDEMGLTELELERQFLFGLYRKHIHLAKQKNTAGLAAGHFQAPDIKETEPVENPNAMKSPMVGVAYLSPEPGAEPFTKVGAQINKGDTILLIEAMKTFNPIKADKNGIIKKILVKDAQAVEYNQPLIIIEELTQEK